MAVITDNWSLLRNRIKT